MSNAVGDDHLLHLAFLEPIVSDGLETVRKAENLHVLLTEPELSCGLPHLQRDFQISDFCLPKTEPTKLLNVLIQLKILKQIALAESHATNFFQ